MKLIKLMLLLNLFVMPAHSETLLDKLKNKLEEINKKPSNNADIKAINNKTELNNEIEEKKSEIGLELIYMCYENIQLNEYTKNLTLVLNAPFRGDKVSIRDSNNELPQCKNLYRNSDAFKNILRSNFPDSFKKNVKGIHPLRWGGLNIIENDDEFKGKNIISHFGCIEKAAISGFNIVPCDEKIFSTLSQGFKDYNNNYAQLKENERIDSEKKKQNHLESIKQIAKYNTVTKVLNYSFGLPDDGANNTFWYTEDEKSCKYKLNGKIVSLFATIENYSIDFNTLDPKLIKFKTQKEVTNVMHNGEPIAVSFTPLDHERLSRGWALIFSKFCAGKSIEF